MKFYFFKSTIDKDSVRTISIFTTSSKKAFNLAHKYFAKNKCKGKPALIAI